MDLFRPARPPFPPRTDTEDLFFPVRDQALLVRATSSGMTLCRGWPKALGPLRAPAHFFGWLRDLPCQAVDFQLPNSGARAHQGPPGYTFREIRSLHGLLSETEYLAAVTALEVLHFERTYRLCPSCGKALERKSETFLKRCAPCAVEFEPRTQPTVVGLVHDGPLILLAQPLGLPRQMYSLPATIVGPGQTLEAALHNVLLRTLGVQLAESGASYFGSQPWPFPDRLIIGLHGPGEAGELLVDPALYSDARWCHVDDLPGLPPPLSLARRMADWYGQLPRVAGRPALPRR